MEDLYEATHENVQLSVREALARSSWSVSRDGGAPLEAFTEETVTDPAELRRLLAEIRRRGYSFSDRPVTTDAISIGAPVYGPRGEVMAALSVVVAYVGSQPRELVPLVRAGPRNLTPAGIAPGLAGHERAPAPGGRGSWPDAMELGATDRPVA